MGERADQPGALDQRDELHRGDQAPLGVAPADQRFDTDEGACGERQLGLVVQLELPAVQRAAELAEQGELVAGGDNATTAWMTV